MDREMNRWLLLVLQLPAQPSNARVKTWRRLQQLGAIAVKNSVYVLPNSAQAIEDFEWLRSEIEALKGQANLFTAASVDGVEEQEIIDQFQTARADEFRQFRRDLGRLGPSAKRSSMRGEAMMRTMRQMRERFRRISDIDFFTAPGGHEAEQELAALERTSRSAVPRKGTAIPLEHLDRKDFKRRIWVTRPRPGVDRFASAWLISRFIDPGAKFRFAADAQQVNDGIPFDMYGAGFRHEGDHCTFETLQARFAIADPTVRRIGEIVHDLDLKEDRFRSPQAPAIGALVEGLRATYDDDVELLEHGVRLFEALYKGLQPGRPSNRTKTRSSEQHKTRVRRRAAAHAKKGGTK